MKDISKRKETLLQETLSEFVLKFGKHIQPGLTDSETCKLFEVLKIEFINEFEIIFMVLFYKNTFSGFH